MATPKYNNIEDFLGNSKPGDGVYVKVDLPNDTYPSQGDTAEHRKAVDMQRKMTIGTLVLYAAGGHKLSNDEPLLIERNYFGVNIGNNEGGNAPKMFSGKNIRVITGVIKFKEIQYILDEDLNMLYKKPIESAKEGPFVHKKGI
jgi:hypothetical protein